MVYRISEQFLIPAITHHTPIKERRQWLQVFNHGEVLAVAASKALNEGVNIPDALVAIVLSGSGSTPRAHSAVGANAAQAPGQTGHHVRSGHRPHRRGAHQPAAEWNGQPHLTQRTTRK